MSSLPLASRSRSRRKNGQPGLRARPGEAEQRLDVEVLLDEVPQQVEAALTGGGEADPRRYAAERRGEERAAQRVSLQAAVPHGAEDVARPGAAEELLAAGDGDAAVVDLVACRWHAEGGARREPQGLIRSEVRADVEQPKALGHGTRVRFCAVRVGDDRAKHLVTAADAEQRPAVARVRGDHAVQAAAAQPGQVADRGPGTRQHDEVRVGEVAGTGG